MRDSSVCLRSALRASWHRGNACHDGCPCWIGSRLMATVLQQKGLEWRSQPRSHCAARTSLIERTILRWVETIFIKDLGRQFACIPPWSEERYVFSGNKLFRDFEDSVIWRPRREIMKAEYGVRAAVKDDLRKARNPEPAVNHEEIGFRRLGYSPDRVVIVRPAWLRRLIDWPPPIACRPDIDKMQVRLQSTIAARVSNQIKPLH